MQLSNLKTLHMRCPVGIGDSPYFSWETVSGGEEAFQKSYEITVRETESGTVVWDTGRIVSEQSTFIPYAGEPLKSRTAYTWHVRTESDAGTMAEAEDSFETALLHESDWMTAWAKAPDKVSARKKGYGCQPPATFFRKSFHVEKEIKKARLYATCHGIYCLTVNGKKADDRVFAPEYTSYQKVLCYQTYDLTDLLTAKAENVIGMYVGDGWYFGPATAMDKKVLKEPHAVLFQLEITLADGTVQLVTSGSGVKTSSGPVLFSNLFSGEKYDARREIPGWDCPGFDDTGWKVAEKGAYGFGNLTPQTGEPVRPVMEIPAVKAYVSPKGENIVDFGQNIAGKVRFHAELPEGTCVTLEHFEVTDKEGNYFNNIVSANGIGEGVEQKTEFISSGRKQDFEAIFSYQGFRYVRVTGLSEVRREDFTAVVLSSAAEETGTFECSREDLNRLYANIRWSQRANMFSIPTDCPQREKAGWTGDIAIYAETALLNEDRTGLLSRWLESLAADQAENGAVPMVVPFNQNYQNTSKLMGMTSGTFGPYGIAGWGDAAVIVPFMMYKVTGNTEILRRQYPSMRAWCEYMIKAAEKKGNKKLPKEKEKYLWNTGFQYGEWLIPSESKNGFDFKNMKTMLAGTSVYTTPIYEYYSLGLIEKTAKILGKSDDVRYFGEIRENVKDAVASCLIDGEGRLLIPEEKMGAYVLFLHFGLVPEKFRKKFEDRLSETIRKNDGCLDTGFLTTPFLLQTLTDMGRIDLAYALLFQTKAPSWLYEVGKGATTIWESWFGYQEDGTPVNVSMNHYSFGCVASWMFANINGISPETPGFRKFLINPRPDPSITWAKRKFHSEYGDIVSDWKMENGRFTIHVEVPFGTETAVILPDGSEHHVTCGSYDFSCGKEQK